MFSSGFCNYQIKDKLCIFEYFAICIYNSQASKLIFKFPLSILAPCEFFPIQAQFQNHSYSGKFNAQGSQNDGPDDYRHILVLADLKLPFENMLVLNIFHKNQMRKLDQQRMFDKTNESNYENWSEELKFEQKIKKKYIKKKFDQQIRKLKRQEQSQNEYHFTTQLQEGQNKSKKKLVVWARDEDLLLFSRYSCEGSKWVEIAGLFPSKNDNDIKNRFYSCIRKLTKKINKYFSQQKKKQKKSISFGSLLTVLQLGKFNENKLDKRFIEIKKNYDAILEAREQIISLATKTQEQITDQQLQPLVSKLADLKHTLKFINFKRVKQSALKKTPEPEEIENCQPINQMQVEQKNEKIEGNMIKEVQNKENTDKIQELEIPKMSKQYISFLSAKNTSLIQSCQDILCPSLVQRQKIDPLYYIL